MSINSGLLVVLFRSVFTYHCLLNLQKIEINFQLILRSSINFWYIYVIDYFTKCVQVLNLVASFSVDPFISIYWSFVFTNIFAFNFILSILFRGPLNLWLYLPHISFYTLWYSVIMYFCISDFSLLRVYCWIYKNNLVCFLPGKFSSFTLLRLLIYFNYLLSSLCFLFVSLLCFFVFFSCYLNCLTILFDVAYEFLILFSPLLVWKFIHFISILLVITLAIYYIFLTKS